MNILLVSADNSKEVQIGGKHIHQELLQRGLEKAGHHVDTVYPKETALWMRACRKLLRTLKILSNFDHLCIYVNDTRIQMEKGVANAFRQKNYQAVSVQDVVAAIAVKSVFQRSGNEIPVIMTLHGYFSREAVNYVYYSGEERPMVMAFGMALEKEAAEFVDGLVTVDTRIKQYVLDNFSYKKTIRVIFNAIDDDRFFPVDFETKRNLRKKINMDNDKKILLVARRLVKKNGVHYAVKAIKILKDNGFLSEMPLKLFIVGHGPEQISIQNLIRDSGLREWVELVGMVPHRLIDPYYKAADIILMPSTRSDDVEEATSLSMLEGMVCGKPVIASAVGGLKEVIHDGQNGLLVEDKNPEAIAASIIKVFREESLRSRLEENAYLYAKKNHGYYDHALQYYDFVNEIITREPIDR